MGVDAGTTSAKAVIVGPDGDVLAEGVSEPIHTDTSAPGGSEQIAEDITSAVATAIEAALAECPATVTVQALAIAAQSGSVVPVRSNVPLGPVITWMDTRSERLVDAWPQMDRDTIRSVSGWSPTSGVGLASIAWLQTQPGFDVVTDGVAPRWASVDDHLVHELTGQWVTNPSNAAGMQLMQAASLEWSPELCRLAGVKPGQLSSIQASGTDLGSVGARGTPFGLAEDVRVIVGGHDQACGALGLGALEHGDVVLSGGTAWVLSVITPPLPVDALGEDYNLSPHVVEGLSSASTFLGPFGAMIASTLADTGVSTSPGGPVPESVGPDAPFFLPDLSNPDRTNWGRAVGGADDLDRPATLAAVFESSAFAIRAALETVPAVAASARPLIFVGGGARSKQLCQIVADACDREVVVPSDASWPALGAARLAAEALGWSLPEVQPAAQLRITPRPDMVALRDRRFLTYQAFMSGDHR